MRLRDQGDLKRITLHPQTFSSPACTSECSRGGFGPVSGHNHSKRGFAKGFVTPSKGRVIRVETQRPSQKTWRAAVEQIATSDASSRLATAPTETGTSCSRDLLSEAIRPEASFLQGIGRWLREAGRSQTFLTHGAGTNINYGCCTLSLALDNSPDILSASIAIKAA